MKSLFDYLKPIAQKIDAKRIVLHASELRKDSSKKITLASALLLSAGTILGATPQHAVAQTNPSYPNFDQRYNVEIPGNLEAIGNASVICDRNNASCADGLANGTRGNNNGSLPMQMLDIDSDGSTFNSSSAQLNLPAGANVRFAALYWGGSLEGFGTTPAPNLTGFNQVSLQVPGSGSYQTITANDQNDRTDFGSWHTYGAFADITTLVQGAGNGTYTVANVQSNTGAGFTYPNAGWSIVVVYEDPAQPVRNISIFDGHDVVRNSFKTFNLTGVRTPPTSGFDVFMGAIANDGEIDQPDDFLHINNNNITDGLNPANNFFNGTISKFGSHVTSRTPNDPFNMVIDIDYLDLTSWNQANNAIPTNATSIDLTLESQGDGIWPLAYFFAVQVFEPNLVAQFEKTTPSTSYVNGDVIPYTISVTNTGNDNATDTVITDAIPTGTTFVPGSLKIGGVTKTDGAGDDEAEFDGSNVIFRVGSGANATQGGQVNINDTVTMTFDVTVTAAPGDLVCNQASIDYEGQTSGNAGSGNSDDPNTPTFGDCTEITTTASAAKDYGDAPDTYGTNDASGGPSHTIVGGIHLGTAPDGESDAETPLDGSGDGAEDDGITLTTLTEGDPSYTIPAGNITATGSGTLHAWLDFDKSGTFELGEYTSIAVTSGTPAGDLSWSGITAGAAGNTYARFRFTSDASINANTPGGAASDGEVEDYQVAISAATPTNFAISGQVRNDTDNDGDLNDADSGISNVTVDLYDDPEGDGDPTGSTELTTKITDGSGNYSFENLAPGNYIVIETDPNGYTSTNDSDNFNNNRIAVNITNADVTGNDFLDSNTPLPPPGPQACGTVYDFTWGAGGAVWNVGDTNNTYPNVDGSGVDVNLVQEDPFNQNIDSDNTFPGRDPFFTQTNGAYGPTYLTWAMTAQNSNQLVSFIFTFSSPILVEDLQVIDLDGTNAGSAANSFQDEIAVIGSLDGVDVPLVITPEVAGTMTVSGQSATGSYTGGNLSHLDSRGHLVIESTAPINTLRLDYSNGPADTDGQSNGHAIAIDQVFQFCGAPTRTISGQVREDVDNDGDLNDADSGIETVTVQLFSDPNRDGDPSDGTLVDTQITNSSGNFSFTNVSAGSYVIIETNSAGFDSTADSAGANDDQIPVYVSTEDSIGNIFLDTATPIASDPNVLLVKRITALNGDTGTTNGDNLASYIDQDDVVYPYDDNTILPVSDPNNAAYDPNDAAFDPRETNQWPTPLSTNLRGGIDGGDVMPNDEVEYTIYYLSSGNTTAESVLFCDYVPTFTSFIPNAYTGSAPQAPGGIGGADLSIELFRNGSTDYHTGANDGDSATYFAPGTDPATSFPGIDCDGDNDGINANTNGTVVVNLGDLPDATTDATGAYGYVRFRTRVK